MTEEAKPSEQELLQVRTIADLQQQIDQHNEQLRTFRLNRAAFKIGDTVDVKISQEEMFQKGGIAWQPARVARIETTYEVPIYYVQVRGASSWSAATFLADDIRPRPGAQT